MKDSGRALLGPLLGVGIFSLAACSGSATFLDWPADDAADNGPSANEGTTVDIAEDATAPVDATLTPTEDAGATTSDAAPSDAGGGGVPEQLVLLPKVISSTGTVPEYRIAVVWIQFSEDGPDPIHEVAYDAPVSTTATRIEIRASDVTLPSEPNFLCPRACNDEASCPCLGDPRVSYGQVVAYRDMNGDGKLTLARTDGGLLAVPDKVIGTARAIAGFSTQTYPKGGLPMIDSGAGDVWNRLWPEGIDKGVHFYRTFNAGDAAGPDAPGKIPQDATFDLQLCAPQDASCKAAGPNLI